MQPLRPAHRVPRPVALALAALTAAAAAPIVAWPAVAAAEPVRADVELDPTAYAFRGHSLHVGLARGPWRVDLGNFAMDLPAFAHADDGVDVAFAGYGVKLQRFRRATRRGWFVGADAGLVRVDAERAGEVVHHHQLSLGVHGGYRLGLPAGCYATAWLGVSYQVGADPMTVAGATYIPERVQLFPAIHLGRAF